MDGKTNGRRSNRTLLLIIGGVIAVLLVAAASLAGALYLQRSNNARIPKDIWERVPFPAYYVRSIPDNFSVDTQSYRYDSQGKVFSFSIVGDNKQKVLVTQQPNPVDFDIAAFNNQELQDATATITPHGKAVIGKKNGRRVASLQIDTTWILFSAPEKISNDELSSLLDGLTKQ